MAGGPGSLPSSTGSQSWGLPWSITMALPPAEAARRVRLLLVVVMIDLSAVAVVVPLLPLRPPLDLLRESRAARGGEGRLKWSSSCERSSSSAAAVVP